MVPEKTLKNPLDKNIKPVNPKGNQPGMSIGRTDAEAEAFPISFLPILPPQLYIVARNWDVLFAEQIL